MRLRAPVLVFLAACHGPENTIRELSPSIAVFPDSLEFGQVGPPREETLELLVSNVGDADLAVTGDLQGDDPLQLVDGPIDAVVSPHEDLTVPVRFAPPTFRTYAGRIVLHTDDALHPAVTIPIHGEGVDLPLPDLQVEPGRAVTADVEVGSSDLMMFDIVNEGDDDLEIGAASLLGAGVFTLSVDPSGTRIAPSQRTTVLVTYAPQSAGGDLGQLQLPSNDPDEPVVTVLLIGNGGGPDLDPPVAVIDPCPAVVQLTGPETVHLSGASSYDPGELYPLRYQWSVTRRPDGSDVDVPLDPDDARDADLYVDVAGPWEASLVVWNLLDVPSARTVCAFDALPDDDLHVELSWDTPTADVDLHLLRGGAELFDVPGDCDYCNKNPSWGAAGDDDDPRLDIDDRGGYGPENINILHPAADDYTVAVHYFAHNSDGPVQATVKVWLNGEETWNGTRVLTGTDVWTVGTVRWPAATFAPDASPNAPVGPVGCH